MSPTNAGSKPNEPWRKTDCVVLTKPQAAVLIIRLSDVIQIQKFVINFGTVAAVVCCVTAASSSPLSSRTKGKNEADEYESADNEKRCRKAGQSE